MKQHAMGAVLSFLICGIASAASFDCKKAVTAYEKTVCTDKALSELDSTLGLLYTEARNKSTDDELKLLTQQQHAWLKQRSLKCPKADITCLRSHYSERNHQLENLVKGKASAIEIKRKNYKIKRKNTLEHKALVEISLPEFKKIEPKRAQQLYQAIGMSAPVKELAKIKHELQEDTWLDARYFIITLNQDDIVQFTLATEGSGAYPSASLEYRAIDVRQGKRIMAQDLFKPASFPALIKLIDRKMKQAQQQSLKQHPDEKEALTMLYQEVKLKKEDLDNMVISSKGIAFVYEYGFPHAIKALTPDDQYFFSYAELMPYLKKDAIVEKLIKN